MNVLLELTNQYLAQNDESKENNSKDIKRKIDVMKIPQFKEALDTFETDAFRKLAETGLEIAPLQFWIMPASMWKGVHNSTEHGTGEVVFDDINKLNFVRKIGGKAYHTIRVFKYAEILMEADAPEVRDYKGRVKRMKPGNEMSARERDLIRTACLWHDIFSGGVEDEFNEKRRSMDKNHPHYHKEQFDMLKDMIEENEWNLLIEVISQHMWKWDDAIDIIKFNDMKKCATVDEAYNYLMRYRIIRIVQLSDFIASRQID